MIDKRLYDFLVDWNEWRLKGAPDGQPYRREFGLCSNQDIFDGTPLRSEHSVEEEFARQGIDFVHPFGTANYKKRCSSMTQHLCPKRIALVERMIAEYEEADG